MKQLYVYAAPLVVMLAAGCSTARVTQLEAENIQQSQYIRDMATQHDQATARFTELTQSISTLERRIAALETTIPTAQTDNSRQIQEMRENITFLTDQLSRIDKSLQGTRAPQTKFQAQPQAQTQTRVQTGGAANVFKPGGFNVETSYEAALADFKAKRYEPAIGGFKEILTVASTSSYADNAQYWIGECYEAMGDIDSAVAAFTKVFEFTSGNKVPDAHLKLGLINERQGKLDAAKEKFRFVVTTYPTTEAATVAGARLTVLGE